MCLSGPASGPQVNSKAVAPSKETFFFHFGHLSGRAVSKDDVYAQKLRSSEKLPMRKVQDVEHL